MKATRILKLIVVLIGFQPFSGWADEAPGSQMSGTDTISLVNLHPETANHSWTYGWKGRVYGLGVSEDTEKSDVAGTQLYGYVTKKFNDYLDAEAGLRGRFTVGSTHSLYDINRVENGILLDQAIVNLNAIPGYVTLTVGAVNQRYLQNPLLLDELSFPGAMEKLMITRGDFSTGVIFQQALPSSSSLSTKTAENEPIPYLFTETAFMSYSPAHPFQLHLRAGRFAFHDLPSQVALDSAQGGNIVNADVPESSRFIYGFSGWTYGADAAADLSSMFTFSLGADGLKNQDAPSEYANGVLTFAQMKTNLTSTWSLTPRFEYFRNERQSSPAFYNSADYGHNNRHGFSYELNLNDSKQGLAFRAKYTDARLIETDPIQANAQIFMLYVELSSDVL